MSVFTYDGPALAWDLLTALEPRRKDRLAEARAIQDPGGASCCRHTTYVLGSKRRLCQPAGWGSGRTDLPSSSAAWDLGQDVIEKALPPCRDCGCVDWEGYYVFQEPFQHLPEATSARCRRRGGV